MIVKYQSTFVNGMKILWAILTENNDHNMAALRYSVIHYRGRLGLQKVVSISEINVFCNIQENQKSNTI